MKEKDLQNDSEKQRYRRICTELDREGISVRLNQNRQTLLSMRYQKNGQLRLSMHYGLLSFAQAVDDVIGFALKGGRGRFPQLDKAMHSVYYANVANIENPLMREQGLDLQSLEVIGDDFDFEASYTSIHQRYFADLSVPKLGWARHSAQRCLRSIRFAAYHPKSTKILLNPRLRYSWIAKIFIEHIFHHELCHHKQSVCPIRGEQSHSRRFRSWEAAYEHCELARQWERLHLSRLLADPEELKDGYQETFLE
ncbi:MAG: hypothetical protein HRU15_15580 [Planctomycetes bacterium]|nr:hypothetical protein [Planctomycetota bacterium]